MGFSDPTPIQLRAFPIILAGKDLIGTAQTGTGKTAAFALPILTLLAEHGAFRCLVLEPTRELAAQVETAFRDYGRFTDLRVSVVHGGVGYGKQREEAARGTDIVCATPGRLLDLLEQGSMHMRDVTILVLDEVDRMLDMGFLPDVRRIVEQISTDAFHPESYEDEVKKRVLAEIQKKVEGQEIAAAPAAEVAPARVIDLMEALKASLGMTKDAERKPAAPAAAPEAAAAAPPESKKKAATKKK